MKKLARLLAQDVPDLLRTVNVHNGQPPRRRVGTTHRNTRRPQPSWATGRRRRRRRRHHGVARSQPGVARGPRRHRWCPERVASGTAHGTARRTPQHTVKGDVGQRLVVPPAHVGVVPYQVGRGIPQAPGAACGAGGSCRHPGPRVIGPEPRFAAITSGADPSVRSQSTRATPAIRFRARWRPGSARASRRAWSDGGAYGQWGAGAMSAASACASVRRDSRGRGGRTGPCRASSPLKRRPCRASRGSLLSHDRRERDRQTENV